MLEVLFPSRGKRQGMVSFAFLVPHQNNCLFENVCVCVCVCMCVCVRERERERERVNMCVCAPVCACQCDILNNCDSDKIKCDFRLSGL